jgi:cell division protein FtsL
MLTGIELALFVVLNIALTAMAVTLSKRHTRRTFTIRRRLGL